MATGTLGSVEPGTESIAPELRIVEWQNEWIVRSAFEFSYPEPNELLVELRERYKLDDVISSGRTEWEEILLVREWVRNQWDHGWSQVLPEKTTNALAILREVERGNDFHCVYYGITLLQCLQALGFVARHSSISKTSTEWVASDEGNVGHSTIEVYSHDWHKWIMLDADMNVHFERNDIPLSALEIHHAWVGGNWDEVRLVHGDRRFEFTRKESSGYLKIAASHDEHVTNIKIFTWHNLGDYAAHASVRLDNRRYPTPNPVRGLQWIDGLTPPKLIDCNTVNHNRWTGNEHDMYPSIDQVQVNLRADPSAWESGEAVLDVNFEDSMPNLEKLLVRVDHEPWHETERNCTWKLNPGKNEIMAKGINSFGREGHMSRILLRFHP